MRNRTELLERISWGEPVGFTSALTERLDDHVPLSAAFDEPLKMYRFKEDDDDKMGLYDFYRVATSVNPYIGCAAFDLIYGNVPGVTVGEVAFVLSRFPHAFDALSSANTERFIPHMRDMNAPGYEMIAWRCIYSDVWKMVNKKSNPREMDIDPNDLMRRAIELGISFDEYIPFVRDGITADADIIHAMLRHEIDLSLINSLVNA